MDGVASKQRERLETIEGELVEVRRRLDRIWQVIETTDIEMADASERIKDHRERKEQLEAAAEVALNGGVRSTVQSGGPGWTRTNDLGLIRTAL